MLSDTPHIPIALDFKIPYYGFQLSIESLERQHHGNHHSSSKISRSKTVHPTTYRLD